MHAGTCRITWASPTVICWQPGLICKLIFRHLTNLRLFKRNEYSRNDGRDKPACSLDTAAVVCKQLDCDPSHVNHVRSTCCKKHVAELVLALSQPETHLIPWNSPVTHVDAQGNVLPQTDAKHEGT